MTSASASLILIRGVMVRSGTNFLLDLLDRHPDCAMSRPHPPEDFFLDESHHLRRFVDRIADRWPDTWEIDRPHMTGAMMEAIGDGLVGFLRAGSTAPRIVAKTPSPAGLLQGDALFPDARVLLLVRDGRGAIDSAMRSFGWSFERGLHTWTRGARQVLDRITVEDPRTSRYMLVRYEEILKEPAVVLPQILKHVGLDLAGLPPSTVAELPVRGSSDSAAGGGPDWTPRPRSEGFDPLSRGDRWDDAMADRFAWVAGDSMRALGYHVEPSRGAAALHLGHDALQLAQRTARLAVQRVRGRVRGRPSRR